MRLSTKEKALVGSFSVIVTSSRRLVYGSSGQSVECFVTHNMSRETGAGPRGDRSRFIETDSGLVQSKYRWGDTQTGSQDNNY